MVTCYDELLMPINFHIPIVWGFLSTLRTLAAMADALDEHLALIRIADAEGFDILNLQAGLDRPSVSM